MSEWRQGWVQSSHGPQRLEAGQRWAWFKYEDGKPVREALVLSIVSTSPSGEVVLRPESAERAGAMFSLHEATFKGKPVQTRDCPFQWVEERVAKGSKGEYQTGDLLCHEAWDVWSKMTPVSVLDPQP